MSAWDVYIWLKLDDFGMALVLAWVLFGLVGVSGIIVIFVEREERKPTYTAHKIVIPMICFGWICGIAAVLLPSTKQMAAIIVAPKIVNSDVVQKDIPELYEMGIGLVKQKMAEAAGAKEKKQ